MTRCIDIKDEFLPKAYQYSDVIIGSMASQINSLTIVYSTVYSGADQRKHQSPVSVTGEFPAQRASNTENVSIWWRHHVNPNDLPQVPYILWIGGTIWMGYYAE